MNLEALTLLELNQLLKDLPAEIRRREAAERKAVVAEMRSLAAARGFDYDALIGGVEVLAPARKPLKPVAIKYRHPQDAALTWTGRGRKPLWVVQWVASGKTLEALAI
ncbi:MAG: H-NS histone family protein [Rhodocyclales bacterium]|nr:H-NS histone family protein [Rhodocyclales bacterium]